MDSISGAAGNTLKEHKEICRLTKGDGKGGKQNTPCDFPFRFEGKVYDGICTNSTVSFSIIIYQTNTTRKHITPSNILSSKLTSYRTLMACYGAQQILLGSVAATKQEEAIGDIAMKDVVISPTQLLVQSTQISSQGARERCY